MNISSIHKLVLSVHMYCIHCTCVHRVIQSFFQWCIYFPSGDLSLVLMVQNALELLSQYHTLNSKSLYDPSSHIPHHPTPIRECQPEVKPGIQRCFLQQCIEDCLIILTGDILVTNFNLSLNTWVSEAPVKRDLLDFFIMRQLHLELKFWGL